MEDSLSNSKALQGGLNIGVPAQTIYKINR